MASLADELAGQAWKNILYPSPVNQRQKAPENEAKIAPQKGKLFNIFEKKKNFKGGPKILVSGRVVVSPFFLFDSRKPPKVWLRSQGRVVPGKLSPVGFMYFRKAMLDNAYPIYIYMI